MPEDAPRTVRRDAARNRERLLAAARQVFAEHGADVALEEVARVAEVSRTTLYRHFTTREELAAMVFEDNVTLIEQRGAELAGAADGVVTLFDLVLEMQQRNRSLTVVLASTDVEWFKALSERTVAAFAPLFERGRQAGFVRPAVDLDDLMMAFAMAAGAMAVGVTADDDRVRTMLHRALFTDQDRPQ